MHFCQASSNHTDEVYLNIQYIIDFKMMTYTKKFKEISKLVKKLKNRKPKSYSNSTNRKDKFFLQF